MTMYSETGDQYRARYQISDAARRLNFVSRVCDQGNNVLFTQTGGWIINHETGRYTWFPREHGVHVLRCDMRDVDACTPIANDQNWLTGITCCISQEAVVHRNLVRESPLLWSSGSVRKVWSSACHAMFTLAPIRRMGPVVSHNFADRWLLVTFRNHIRQLFRLLATLRVLCRQSTDVLPCSLCLRVRVTMKAAFPAEHHVKGLEMSAIWNSWLSSVEPSSVTVSKGRGSGCVFRPRYDRSYCSGIHSIPRGPSPTRWMEPNY